MSEERLIESPPIKVKHTVKATGRTTAPAVFKRFLEDRNLEVVSIDDEGRSMTRGDGEGSMKPYEVAAVVRLNVMSPNNAATLGIARAKLQSFHLTLVDD